MNLQEQHEVDFDSHILRSSLIYGRNIEIEIEMLAMILHAHVHLKLNTDDKRRFSLQDSNIFHFKI